MGVTTSITRGRTRGVTGGITGMGAGTPAVVSGPTLTDNGDGTYTLSVEFDRACFCGFDYGTATATYTESALSYTNDDPNDVGGLLFSTTHAFTIPEQALGTETLAEDDYFGRLAAGGASYNSFGYVNAEQTFTVSAGAVAVVGTPARQNATSFSYTVDADANYLVVVAQWVDVGTVTVSGMTYNGVAMTRLAAAGVQSNSSGLYLGCDVWYLANPATGANTLSATFSGNSFTPSLGAIGLSGVASFGTPATNSAGNPPGSATITAGNATTDASGLLIGAVSVSQNSDTVYTVGGSGTNHWNAADATGLGRIVGATVPGTGGAVNFTEVQGGASPWNQGWVATSVPVNP